MIGTCEVCGRQGVRVRERPSHDLFAVTPARVVLCVDRAACYAFFLTESVR